mgnify:CR=1 FL=1
MKKRNRITIKTQADNGRQLTDLEKSMKIQYQFGDSSIGYNGHSVVFNVSGILMLDQDDLKQVIEFLQTKIIEEKVASYI